MFFADSRGRLSLQRSTPAIPKYWGCSLLLILILNSICYNGSPRTSTPTNAFYGSSRTSPPTDLRFACEFPSAWAFPCGDLVASNGRVCYANIEVSRALCEWRMRVASRASVPYTQSKNSREARMLRILPSSVGYRRHLPPREGS